MKNDWLITFRSITFAQKGERRLRQDGISCDLLRTPRLLSERGCGYCLRIRGKDAVAAVALLREQEILFGKVYAVTGSGKPEERQL